MDDTSHRSANGSHGKLPNLSVEAQLKLIETLEAERSRLVAAQSVAKVGSWETDFVTQNVTWSEETHRIHETDPATFQPTHPEFLQIVHPDDRNKVDEAFQKSFGLHEPCLIEHRLLMPDGRIKYVEERWQAIFDEKGNPVRAIGTCQDVTERKLAHDALSQALNRLNEAQRIGKIGDWRWDFTTNKISWSDQVYVIFGRDPAQGPPADYEELSRYLDTDNQAIMNARVENAIATGVAEDYELLIIRPDKKSIPVHARAIPNKDESGKVFELYGIVQDITERRQAEAALRESELRFRTLFDNSLTGIYLLQDNRLTYVNPSLERIFGYQSGELTGHEPFILIHPDDHQLVAENMRRRLVGEVSEIHYEFRGKRKDGAIINIEVYGSRIDLHNRPCIIGNILDITERKQATIRLAYLNRVYAMLSNINSLIVRAKDHASLFEQACHIAVKEGGFGMALISLVKADKTRLEPVASAGQDDQLVAAVKHIITTNEETIQTLLAMAVKEKRIIVSNNSQADSLIAAADRYIEAGIRSMAMLPLVVAGEVAGVIGFYSKEPDFFHDDEIRLLTDLAGDIAFAIDHINKQERLNYLAYYDVITGLANRSLFMERLPQYMKNALAGGHKLALFMINLERFKNINDSLGRQAGDDMLRQVAEWLKKNVGDVSLLARISSDRFAVILPEVRPDGNLPVLLDKMMDSFMEHPFTLNDTVYQISSRIGVTIFPDDGNDADALLRNSEAAIKQAKTTGDKYVFFTKDMAEDISEKLKQEIRLKQALKNNEFQLYYQPKASLLTGQITGAEALIRWKNPEFEQLLAPDKFIPLLEETGMIIEVGRWVMRKTLEDYLYMRDAGIPDIRFAFNVSPFQLRSRGFLPDLINLISIDRDAVNGLELEITENLIMEDVRSTNSMMHSIRDLGIRIAIDDFGTGFSSLSYLAKLPVDTLKIDRSFVSNMTQGAEGLALISTIINLAHSMKLKVVAEGVETDEQSHLLRLLGCDEMQGYVFSKPITMNELKARILTEKSKGSVSIEK